jgi:hypothetical protein
MPAQALDFMYLCQAIAEHFQQCAEFPLLRNRGLGPIELPLLIATSASNSQQRRPRNPPALLP